MESFNGSLRDECPNITSYRSLTHARVIISDENGKRQHYVEAPLTTWNRSSVKYAETCTHIRSPDPHIAWTYIPELPG